MGRVPFPRTIAFRFYRSFFHEPVDDRCSRLKKTRYFLFTYGGVRHHRNALQPVAWETVVATCISPVHPSDLEANRIFGG